MHNILQYPHAIWMLTGYSVIPPPLISRTFFSAPVLPSRPVERGGPSGDQLPSLAVATPRPAPRIKTPVQRRSMPPQRAPGARHCCRPRNLRTARGIARTAPGAGRGPPQATAADCPRRRPRTAPGAGRGPPQATAADRPRRRPRTAPGAGRGPPQAPAADRLRRRRRVNNRPRQTSSAASERFRPFHIDP